MIAGKHQKEASKNLAHIDPISWHRDKEDTTKISEAISCSHAVHCVNGCVYVHTQPLPI